VTPLDPPGDSEVDGSAVLTARCGEGGGALAMLVPEAEHKTGRQDHRLPARATTRCWITPEAVVS
jgi:hypothetical protein